MKALFPYHHPEDRPRAERWRRNLGAFVADSGFRSLAHLSGRLPMARPEWHGLGRVTDVAYRQENRPEFRLDIYRPRVAGPHPVVFYVHGGGFRMLSKDSHWLMGLLFARRGYLTFNVSYRLAPAHPFPAAIEDVCLAYQWVGRNLEAWGGDPGRVVVAGESAGGNLALALTLAATQRRPEFFARGVFEHAPRIQATLPACGMLQVSDPERFGRRRPIPRLLLDRLEEVRDCYLRDVDEERAGGLELADPLCVLESGVALDRRLPPFFTLCGTRDPLLDDSRRLHAALERRRVRSELAVYPGEAHVFHTFLWRRAAREAWRRTFRFLDSVPALQEEGGGSSAARNDP
ncbi:MAG: alpha/beta hydrolase [Deltaproteobacteria bacterium]|nr:alpha/beta hydrolase [Deltaproteobacteria bacterium]